MAKNRTIHVIPADAGWAVRGDGSKSSVHATQAGAVKAAKNIIRTKDAGQYVVVRGSGGIGKHGTRGLPEIKDPPRKSKLGTRKIEEAVGCVVLNRLKSSSLPPRA